MGDQKRPQAGERCGLGLLIYVKLTTHRRTESRGIASTYCRNDEHLVDFIAHCGAPP